MICEELSNNEIKFYTYCKWCMYLSPFTCFFQGFFKHLKQKHANDLHQYSPELLLLSPQGGLGCILLPMLL
jgi:hypothetical protein